MEKIKLPNWQRTYEYIGRLAEYISFGVIAQRCGKEIQTAEAWARVPESNENPLGNGKKNPLDTVLRLIGLAHKEDAGLAREIAEMFLDYVAVLDGRQGVSVLDCGGSINEVLGQSAKEHADVLLAILKSEKPDWSKAYSETKQAQAALGRVEACIKKEMQAD